MLDSEIKLVELPLDFESTKLIGTVGAVEGLSVNENDVGSELFASILLSVVGFPVGWTVYKLVSGLVLGFTVGRFVGCREGFLE